MAFSIRLITPADLPAIVRLQESCYSEALYESPAILLQRLEAAPKSCWLAEDATGQLLAYLFSYPSLDRQVSALAAPFNVPVNPNVLYLHDLAVSSVARGLAIPAMLLATAKGYAHQQRLSKLALVAVQGALPYWQRHGFQAIHLLPKAATTALASYQPEHAHYMQLTL